MPIVKNYKHFGGRHAETGAAHNYFAARGVKAPHTGKPYSEAMMLGISGGVMMGYFSFAYKGIDPHVAILPRNTFNPFDTLMTRLGVVQHLQRTTDPKKALQNLLGVLEDGAPAIVWVDMFSLPYNNIDSQEGWGMYPLVVYGYDAEADEVLIADRAAVPLTISTAQLAAGRARVKKDKFRMLTADPPDPAKLPVTVQQAIWDCLQRYTESPVKSAKKNFGLAAFERWAEVLTNPKDKQSWHKVFAPGVNMYAGLWSAYDRFSLGSVAAQHDRNLYAEFLDEASLVLKRSSLKQAARAFRACAEGWGRLGPVLLPDAVKPFKETRQLLDRRREAFVEQGGKAQPQLAKIDARLMAIRQAMVKGFPLTADEAGAMRERLAEAVLQVGALERAAYESLRDAMAEK